ncbi:hypothetical protein [Halorubellus sp. PRR65]|uniref:hypothetical protein n=1 Tax=Halorubellus sp. PRR65 TaxID=3098148 RepID=UPI002B257B32|nr:hypothetical protein [Halorubellus sp. PRR65]
MSQASYARRTTSGQPPFVLDEDSTRTRGSDAQRSNIAAGRAIAAATEAATMIVRIDDIIAAN